MHTHLIPHHAAHALKCACMCAWSARPCNLMRQARPTLPQSASDRATALRRQVSTLHHRAKELEQVIGVLFQGVFAHRFR